MKKIQYVLTVLVALSMVLSACSTPTATTPPPTTAPAQATTAPSSPTQAPAATQPPAAPAATTAATTAPAATSAPSGSGPTIKGQLTFVMVQHALCAWDSFWCTVEQGIKDAAKQMNVNVTILGPDKFDLEKTAALIDQAT